MKQRLTIVVMVVLAAILIASPVLAAGSSHSMEVAKQGPRKRPTVISMTGTILDLYTDPDTGAKMIQIDIQMTNRAFIQYRRTTMSVRTTPTTKYLWWDGKKRTYITYQVLAARFEQLDDLKVSINAKLRANGNFYARRVQAFQPRIPQ